jgi:excisionase family DNA binding protein
MPLLDSYYKVPEAATLLGVHAETVKRLCQRGRIPAEKVHNTWLIQKEKLQEFAATYRNPRRANAATPPEPLKQDKER